MDHFAQSMDSKLLEAAKKGDIDAFEHISPEELARVVTPLNNTILHVHIAHQDTEKDYLSASIQYVEDILVKCPSLLQQVNANGETLFHVAAKCGHLDALEVFIAHAKEEIDSESGVTVAHLMLRETDNDRNTALHLAVLHNKSKVVEFLVKEDCDFPYTTNARGETPLYLAAEKDSHAMVDYILDNCPSAAHEGPDGKTALHVSASVQSASGYITGKILQKKGKWIARVTDQNGWTALHVAAYHWNILSVGKILEYDASIAIIADKQRKMTALHLAAGRGSYSIMEEIISKCPDCYDMVDIKGWNALHFAMCSMWRLELKNIKRNLLLQNLILKKDLKGNIPLHVLKVIRPETFYRHGHHLTNKVPSVQTVRGNLEPEEILEQEIQDLSKSIDNGPYYRGVLLIKKDEDEDEDSTIQEMAEKAKEYHLVVAGLIATVTFTAAFTLPGGFESEKGKGEGIAILRKSSAFQAFVVTNTISFVFSLSAVLLHFLISIPLVVKQHKLLFFYAFGCTIIAMAGMVIAFVTGSYAVLSPSLGLAIVICFLGLSFFILVISMTGKLIPRIFRYIFYFILESWTKSDS